ncbi:hypothetical protein GM921_16435 [Pedobacter sp. LMG 31464]|uniref:Uncharacterized protein n=1 Tax=Pedobacter planticolens TaxID=2679964 RepID=A0A923DZQ7_9SPHI|nr:hypothetical protein [Pedobacter planticolens]MBB2147094.1 hypothetical protein [Pedobacter planticolens]
MKKNIFYSLIALMGLFAACKKEPKPVDHIVTNPYKNSRPIEVSSDDGRLTKYSYNATNQVIKAEYYQNGTLNNLETYTYTNGKLTQIALEKGTSIKNTQDFTYQGNTDIIESIISTSIKYINPAQPITTLTSTQYYSSYADGTVFKVTTKNGMDVTSSIRTYTFSVKGENPFVTIDFFPQALNGNPVNPAFNFNITTEYYKDVFDPMSHYSTNSTFESKFIPKSGAISTNENSYYTQTYELDNVGRIKTISTTYPSSQNTMKTTYTYETY